MEVQQQQQETLRADERVCAVRVVARGAAVLLQSKLVVDGLGGSACVSPRCAFGISGSPFLKLARLTIPVPTSRFILVHVSHFDRFYCVTPRSKQWLKK